MPEILINTEQVTKTGADFAKQADELHGLLGRARSQMSALESVWKGVRKTNTFNDWNSVQKNLDDAVLILQRTSEILKRAAADFEATDQAR
jgi:WXG100 family type VII secretion target